jgi:hypothetical protein
VNRKVNKAASRAAYKQGKVSGEGCERGAVGSAVEREEQGFEQGSVGLDVEETHRPATHCCDSSHRSYVQAVVGASSES